MRKKSEVFDRWLEFMALMENQTGKSIKALRTDNGGEYSSREFSEQLKKKGIRHECTVPHNPEQNGVAERMNRTIKDMIRAMLQESKMPAKYWAEAAGMSVFILNRVSTKKLDQATPFEAYYGKKSTVYPELKIFGSFGYAHLPKAVQRSLGPRSELIRLVGYSETVKGFKVVNEAGRIYYSRSVSWKEGQYKKDQDQQRDHLVDTNADDEFFDSPKPTLQEPAIQESPENDPEEEVLDDDRSEYHSLGDTNTDYQSMSEEEDQGPSLPSTPTPAPTEAPRRTPTQVPTRPIIPILKKKEKGKVEYHSLGS